MNTIWRNRLLAGITAAALAAGPAFGQSPAPPPPPPRPTAVQIDTQSLPAVSGTVAHYTLTPRGDVDGLVLTDGTEVNVSPRLSSQLVFIANAWRQGHGAWVEGAEREARGCPLGDQRCDRPEPDR